MTKKISLGMIEAGVSAMARVQRTKQSDAAVVSVIYSAMEAVHQNEERSQKIGAKAEPYVHQDWPRWMYGPDGHERVFNSPEEVPEGWTSDEPVTPPAARRGRPPKHAE